MRIEPFEYVRPETLDEACSVLAKNGSGAKILAGGTDLLVRIKLGVASANLVVDVKGVAELVSLRENGKGLSIGAGTSVKAIQHSAIVRERLPALVEAAARVGSPQLRAMGTIGGNVLQETMCWFYNQSRQWRMIRARCNKAGGDTCHVAKKADVCYATYRGDLAPALIALGATAILRRGTAERTLPLEDIFTGDGKNHLNLEPGQLLLGFNVPFKDYRAGSAFLKLSHRSAVDYPLLSVGVSLTISEDGDACVDARIVLGAVGSGPTRALEAENVLRGKSPTSDLIREAAQAVVKYAHPMENMTYGSPRYRREMARVLSSRALESALARANGTAQSSETNVVGR